MVARPTELTARAYRRIALAVLVLAAVWRVVSAATIPCIARDSVTFCWYARDLGERGLEYLREPTTRQHPLFPAIVLGTQRVARSLGAPDTPLTWQRSGQLVSILAGLAVVVLAGALTRRLVRRLELPVDENLASCCGMLLAALLDRNVWLSSEVMSDQLHAAFYLAGALVLLKLDSAKAALLCGLAGGLAFLTRPEGIVVVPAGLVVLLAERSGRWAVRVRRGLVLLAAFLLCAVPFWWAVGTLSPKKNPLNWLRGSETAVRMPAVPLSRAQEADWCESRVAAATFVGPASGRSTRPTRGSAATWVAQSPAVTLGLPLLAKLELVQVQWYWLVPRALEEFFRAGRVVLPLLALFPLINLRRRLLRPPLIGISACLAGHFTLAVLLLHRHHYLAPRHMLVMILLLTPFAATLLARLIELAHDRRRRALSLMVIVVSLLPLALYSLRRFNYDDRYLVDAARWMTAYDPQIPSKVIMGGSSSRRLAFYTDAAWLYRYDDPWGFDELRGRLFDQRPDYFVIETGPGYERDANEHIVEALRRDETLAPGRTELEPLPIPRGGTLFFFTFDWLLM